MKYRKAGKQIEFDQTHFPADFDSTYEYLDRKDKLVKKGNGLQAKIVDFSLQSLSGADTTAAVFAQTTPYIMVLAKDMEQSDKWAGGFETILRLSQQKSIPILIVTADADKAVAKFANTTVVKCDATVLKTAARVTPTYFFMKGAVVLNKISYVDFQKVLDVANNLK